MRPSDEALTKAGNGRVRHMLVESAWTYRHPPKVGAKKLYRLEEATESARDCVEGSEPVDGSLSYVGRTRKADDSGLHRHCPRAGGIHVGCCKGGANDQIVDRRHELAPRAWAEAGQRQGPSVSRFVAGNDRRVPYANLRTVTMRGLRTLFGWASRTIRPTAKDRPTKCFCFADFPNFAFSSR